MKKLLNPKLIRLRIYQDLEKTFEPQVVLREPENLGEFREIGIGYQAIEVITEDAGVIAEFKKSLKEDMIAAGEPTPETPHVLLARDCFGFEGAVRILIFSNAPFSRATIA